MKALETSYAGCRFRSRLEARWAVALTTDNWIWEYEPEGYEIDDHFSDCTPLCPNPDYHEHVGRYLPDFRITPPLGWAENPTWLRHPDIVEVKPPDVVEKLVQLAINGDQYVANDCGQYEPELEPILKCLGLVCHDTPFKSILVVGGVQSWGVRVRFHKGDWELEPDCIVFSDKAVQAARSERFGT